MDEQKNLTATIKGWIHRKPTQPLNITTRDKGQKYETLALQYLIKQGLSTVTTNYRCKFGEIDLIMRHKSYLVFIEVRNRKTQQFGSPVETVTQSKQKKLIKTAKHYIVQNKISANQDIRFDVIGITDEAEPPINWVQNAFYANENF